MKSIIYSFLLLVFIFITACEEQPIPITQMAPNTDRKILIEEFTGANCAACPGGARTIKAFEDQFPGKIISIAIHTTDVGPLGTPLPGSIYDLRTQDGSDLFDLFGGLGGIPAAVFNRTKFPGELKMGIGVADTWGTFVLSELENEPIVEVTTSLSYDADTREVTIDIEAFPLVDATGDFRVNVMITESHIIEKQNDNNVIIDDYENNHVLREIISLDLQGDPLASSFSLNTPITKQYVYTIPAEDGIWVAENCNIVTFVSKVNSDDGTFQVLQADEAHIGE